MFRMRDAESADLRAKLEAAERRIEQARTLLWCFDPGERPDDLEAPLQEAEQAICSARAILSADAIPLGRRR
jgi:hypothetical protein